MNLVDLQPGRPIPEPRTRPPAPMLPIALGMMAGILIDAHIQMPIALSAAVVVACAAACTPAGRRWAWPPPEWAPRDTRSPSDGCPRITWRGFYRIPPIRQKDWKRRS